MPEGVGLTILVVDDNAQNRYILSRYLMKKGFTLLEAGTGREALELSLSQPNLIILDVQLPDILGFDVCRQLKANPATASIPVLQTSANFTSSEKKIKGLEGGADGYITAPFEPEELFAMVRSLLRMREAEMSARALAAEWQKTFDAISDAVCLISPEGKIVRRNRAFVSTFEASPETCFSEAFPFPELKQIVKEAFNGKSETGAVIEMNQRWQEFTITPVQSEDRAVSNLVVIISDVTEKRAKAEELRLANARLAAQTEELESHIRERTAKLQETVAELEAFSYSVSHDLRSPLRAMNGYAQLLLDDYASNLNEEALEYLRRIKSSGARLDQLIQDILAYSRLSRSPIELKAVNLDELLEQIVHQQRHFISPDSRIELQQPLGIVLGHEASLTQVFLNLIGNAVKFVKPGDRPFVQIRSHQSGGFVRVEVQDAGIGINPEHHGRIFGIFEKLHSAETYSGTGIGLAIVKRAVIRLNGELGVESLPGEGSLFWIKLPAATG
ncbi:MAG: ATP-binding protein [Verrucomicrobiota bacterium]|nr:ATP-binding protein [Verrucomicrobiota bacterium]